MAVSPVNVSRISQNFRTSWLVDSLRRNELDVFQSQNRIASGRRFVNPSEDPISAARALNLSQALARQEQFARNAQHGDNSLAAADSALTEISSLLIEALTIASQTVGSLTTADEREAEAEVVASIRQQLLIVGNRQFDGRYLFGGRDTLTRPFVDGPSGIFYAGDTGEMFTRLSERLFSPFNLPGSLLFGALSDSIASDTDLTPLLTDSTRLEDITGALGREIRSGTLLINEINGAGAVSIDLSRADTIGDVAAAINQAAVAAGASFAASLSGDGLLIQPGGFAVAISDGVQGSLAADLGILTTAPASSQIVGRTLVPRLTRLTPIAAIAGGTGIDLTSGLIITNESRTAIIDLSSAVTVQDIINTINNAGVSVLARINDAGTGIDVLNRVSGSSLTIGENGGTTAADLGIRTMDTATPLTELNVGEGVGLAAGADDLQIVAKDGSTFNIDLDGARTIGDVIDRINSAASTAGIAVTASFATTGNGIRVTDGTGGLGDLRVLLANLSTAAMDLGVQQTVSGATVELIGRDVNPVRTTGILDALIDLENALRADDTQGISRAGSRLDELNAEVIRIHGIIGARSQAMTRTKQQLEDAALTTRVFLSQIQDLDYAEAVTRMQEAMTRLQANLQTGSLLMNVSLLDFLR